MRNFTLSGHLHFRALPLILIMLVSLSQRVNAQTFWTETFSNGCTANCNANTYTGPNGSWTVTSVSAEGASANKWFISCAEDGLAAGSCGTGCSASDPSLHVGTISNLFCSGGDCGAAYNATGAANVTDKRAESPVINCTGYTGITIAFNYIGVGQTCTTDFTDLQYSSNGGTTWNNLQTCLVAPTCGSGQGQWTAFSTTLPAVCDNNANVKIGFHWKNNGDGMGSDPSFAVDDITLSVVSAVNTITTGTVSSPICACATISVPFTSTGTFTAGNIYTAQLSNSAGSFAAPVSIGTLASTANTGTITATIPCGTPAGTGYRIRVVSSAPAIIGTDNGVNLTINATVTPSVSISSTATTICAGNSVNFTATPTNGGAVPTYQWQVNGVNVAGATSSSFSSTSFSNGDVVTVIMTSTAACPSPATATSNSITVTVQPVVAASVSIISNPSPAVICAGDPVLFTATPTNGGSLPVYQWQVNGVNAGTNSPTFSSSSLPNGAVVTVIMTSNASCVTGSPATSNSITVTVQATVAASVSIAASPTGTVCAGQSVVFTATPTGGGATPTYQWQVNGVNAGTNSPTFTSSSLNNGDQVQVIMTSSSSCSTGSPATSNTITMTVTPAVTPTISITGTPTSICSGDPVTFTATITNGGSTPVYQWQVNGTNAGTNSSTFTTTTLNNGDVVTCILTSNAACASPATVTSNSVTITVTTSVTPTISITGTPTSICVGDPVTFTATITNGGTTPVYQWQVNGTNAGTNSATFTTTTLNNGDVVTCILTSNAPCASPVSVTSNSVSITVTTSVTPTISITGTPTSICSGDPVTFTATITGGGATPTYQWQVNGVNAGTNSPTFTTTTLSNGDVVTCILTSSSSCATTTTATSNSVTITVTTSVTPTISITGSPTSICVGDPVTFTATISNGGSTPTYQWQVNGTNAGTNSSTFTSSTLNNGDVVTCILTSNAACASPATVTSNPVSITVSSCTPPVANFTADQTNFCMSGCVNFTDLSTNSPLSWSWSFPGGTPSSSTSQNPTGICYSATGSYSVLLIASNASGSDTLLMTNYITIGLPVPVSISGNTNINACESTALSAFPADGTYSWGPNVNMQCATCQTVTVAPTATQDYYVTYTSPLGCVDSDTITVNVTDIYTYFMPTGFSPNGDGVNDSIVVHGRGIDFINLKIFDRIGEKVFETSDITQGWDGKLHHVSMNDNVFVYILEVTFCNGETVKEHGNITLVK